MAVVQRMFNQVFGCLFEKKLGIGSIFPEAAHLFSVPDEGCLEIPPGSRAAQAEKQESQQSGQSVCAPTGGILPGEFQSAPCAASSLKLVW